jgi:hypothetical protein
MAHNNVNLIMGHDRSVFTLTMNEQKKPADVIIKFEDMQENCVPAGENCPSMLFNLYYIGSTF